MISTNKITKGLSLAVAKAYQPEGTVTVNHNGQFISYEEGSLKWVSAKGNIPISIRKLNNYYYFSSVSFNVMKMVSYDNYLIVFGIKTGGVSSICKLRFIATNAASVEDILDDASLNFSLEHPIRQAYVVYENENIIRLYWNDGYNPPRSLNILDIPDPLQVEQLNFTPPSTMGTIKLYTELASGSLYCTNYYYTYRLLTSDGVVSDFSMLSNPVSIAKEKESSNTGYFGYQNYQGDNFDVKSNIGVQLEVLDVDTDYDYIEVYAFKSIALNSLEPGVLIYKADITSATMYISHTGNENLGSVTMDEVIVHSRVINQCNLLEISDNRAVIADFTERSELPESAKILRNKIIGATLTPMLYYAPTDIKGLPGAWTTSDGIEAKPLVGCPINYGTKLSNQWYYDQSDGAYTLGTGGLLDIKEADEYPVIRIRKYKKTDGSFEYENHSLANQFLDYKSKKMASFLKGYRGGETYRFGFVPIDLNGKEMAVRWIGDVVIPQRNGSVNKLLTQFNWMFNMNIMSVELTHIDLSDLVTVDGGGNAVSCLISGFKIVRAPLDKQRISQGVLFPVVTKTVSSYPRSLLCWPRVGNTTYDDGDGRIKNLYSYHSPEYSFEYPDAVINPGDVFEVVGYLTGYSSDNSYVGPLQVSNYNYYQKYYIDGARVAQGGTVPDYYKPIGTENEIMASYPWPFDKDGGSDVRVDELSVTVRNEAGVAIYSNNRSGYGTPSTLVVLKNTEVDNNDHFGSFDHHTLLLVNQVRKKSSLYGGTDDAALAATTYIETGHYQPVTTTILNAIKDVNGAFKFHNVQVFGGDTFVNIFDLHRVIRYKRDTTQDWFSHSIIFPVESEMNLALRTGYHIAKDRAYDEDYNNTGIGIGRVSYIKYEDFNYNDAYSTSITGKFSLPLPYNFMDVTRNKYSIIWSGVKFLGETKDNYRIFPVNNIKTVDTLHGPITYIFGAFEKLIYLQEKGFGYLPINERVMINNNQNLPVQLGIGGVFDRDNTVNKWIGCQHYFSVARTPEGIAWFDFNNRAFMYMSYDLKTDNKSVVAGLEPFFNSLQEGLRDYDTPSYNYGIFSHYDIERKEVIMTFLQPTAGSDISITFNDKSRTFTGTLDFLPTGAINFLGKTYATKKDLFAIYLSNAGANRNYFGTAYLAKIRFIINNNNTISKIFDNFKIIGTNKFFNTIRYIGENFSKDEIVTDNSANVLSDYLKYYNFEWLGSFPIVEGERLRGHFIEMELEIDASNANDIGLLELITINRKSY